MDNFSWCLLEKSDLMSKTDKKFKKDVAKAIYKSHSAIYVKVIGSDPWAEAIDKAVESCDFPTHSNMSLNLPVFYNCTNNKLFESCATFASSDECDYIQEAHEKCTKVKPECGAWPVKIMLPEFCCVTPEIILPVTKLECQTQCAMETIQIERIKCTLDCINQKINIKPGGKLDFDTLGSVLKANANKSANWDSSIDKAIEVCKPIVEGKFLKKSLNCLNDSF